jgi:DUF1365 family protein
MCLVSANSAIYTGAVMHRRLAPRRHRFRYRGFWLLLDLDELDSLTSRLRFFSHNRFNLFSLDDRDHGDGSAAPLRVQIEARLRGAGIDCTGGRIRLLCMPRSLGHCFNPLSVYFCDDAEGRPLAIVYQVHNTFGERHSYVLPARGQGRQLQACDKAFYVSPFMDIDLRYEFAVSMPGERLNLAIRLRQHGETLMVAVLAGERRALDDRGLLRLFLTIPAQTLTTVAAIHWEALRLWLKGLRIRRHVPARVAG